MKYYAEAVYPKRKNCKKRQEGVVIGNLLELPLPEQSSPPIAKKCRKLLNEQPAFGYVADSTRPITVQAEKQIRVRGKALVLSTLPAIGFFIGGGFCWFEIDKGAADIAIDDVAEQVISFCKDFIPAEGHFPVNMIM